MRIVFGILGLVIVLAIISQLAKRQLNAVSEIKPPSAQGAQGAPALAPDPNASVQQQSQQMQQQFKQAVEAGTRPRQMDDPQ